VLFVCEPVEGADERDAVRYASRWRDRAAPPRRASPDPALVVDADLRPEGRNGPLVRTLESYREYYARWSEAWEAQALLRAAPVAGDPTSGRRFIEMIDPIRYPADGLDQARHRDPPDQGAGGRGAAAPRRGPHAHTKLGLGGLADVEWTMQLLQLQHAGDIPELRTTSRSTACARRARRA
jgi:glutamate-ammonia-ligase adenylyltransferase